MASKVRSNKYHGKPGEKTFKYKLPKGITSGSISFSLSLIFNCHKSVPQGLSPTDFYLGELSQIYPDLNIEIGRHFVIIGEPDRTNHSTSSMSNNSSIVSINNDESTQSEDHDPVRNCMLCNLMCDVTESICMKCRCINQRLDQLTMDMKQVKHAIVAMLDNPQSNTSSSQRPPFSSTRQTSQPSPPGTSSLPVHPPRPRKGPSSSQPPGIPSRSSFPQAAPAPVPSQAATAELYQYAFPPLRPSSYINPPYPPKPHPNAYAPSHHLSPPRMFENPQPPRSTFQPSMFTPRQRSTTATRFGPYGNRAYASVVRESSTMYGTCCEYCGEPNHRANTCRHGIQLQCRRCNQLGHKEKFCTY